MSELTREGYHRLFVDLVNQIQPSHCYYDGTHPTVELSGDPWPLSMDELSTSYRRADGRGWGFCGPRRAGNTVHIALNLSALHERTDEWAVRLLVHELTHISCGSYTDVQHGSHPPRFWELMADYGNVVLADLSVAEAHLGPLDAGKLREALIASPNRSTVDRRYHTVEEAQGILADRLIDPSETPEPATPETPDTPAGPAPAETGADGPPADASDEADEPTGRLQEAVAEIQQAARDALSRGDEDDE